MNTVRRGLLLMPLTTADILGASVSARAAFGDPIKVDTTIVTRTVAAPASLSITGYGMAQTAAGTLSTSRTVDADNLVYQPRLSVTTLTGHGWSAQSALTGYATC